MYCMHCATMRLHMRARLLYKLMRASNQFHCLTLPDLGSFENTINLFSEIFKQNNLKIEVVDIWVAKYVSQDYAKKHNHGDALWSFCIYLNEGKDFPPIELEGYGKVKAEKGLVIFFPSWVFHSVESKEFEGARYVCAGNIYTKGQR